MAPFWLRQRPRLLRSNKDGETVRILLRPPTSPLLIGSFSDTRRTSPVFKELRGEFRCFSYENAPCVRLWRTFEAEFSDPNCRSPTFKIRDFSKQPEVR